MKNCWCLFIKYFHRLYCELEETVTMSFLHMIIVLSNSGVNTCDYNWPATALFVRPTGLELGPRTEWAWPHCLGHTQTLLPDPYIHQCSSNKISIYVYCTYQPGSSSFDIIYGVGVCVRGSSICGASSKGLSPSLLARGQSGDRATPIIKLSNQSLPSVINLFHPPMHTILWYISFLRGFDFVWEYEIN